MGLLLGLLLSGCAVFPSHLHNEASAQAARDAKATMAEYAENAPAMYSAMLANVERFKVEEEYLLGELAANAANALITELPSANWQAVSQRIDAAKSTLEEFEDQVRLEAERYLRETRASRKQIRALTDAVEAAKDAVSDAKAQVATWNAYVALLQMGLTNLPVQFDQLKKQRGLTDIAKAAAQVGKETVVYADADGRLRTNQVQVILKEAGETILASMRSDTNRLGLIPDAPGIAVLILNSGLELAQVEKEKAEARLEQLAARAVLFEDEYAGARVVWQLLEDARTNDLPVLDLGARVSDDIGTRAKARRPDGIATGLTLLRSLALAEVWLNRHRSLFALAVARLEHRDSILDSQFADRSWQVVIRSGLDGLVAYHESGFNDADAANLIRIAQSVALAFIAYGTY